MATSVANGTTNCEGYCLQAASGVGVAARVRRYISPQAGRSIEMLGHAIEYLADEFAVECMDREARKEAGVHPQVVAIEVLKSLNREIYFSCPEVHTVRERLRTLLRLERA